MPRNVNTPDYWERRFSSGDWERQAGREQTTRLARGVAPLLAIPPSFDGALVDFGCGLGDAMPVFHEAFPDARLLGVDISQSAIDRCRERYGAIASFQQGDYESVPNADVIVASNVIEHLSNGSDVVRHLLSRCGELYVFVPYREYPMHPEHVASYDENGFADVGPAQTRVFLCPGWSQYGWALLWHIHFKNVVRCLLGRRPARRGRQIMFRFRNPDFRAQSVG